jgi:hypothetical protein
MEKSDPEGKLVPAQNTNASLPRKSSEPGI